MVTVENLPLENAVGATVVSPPPDPSGDLPELFGLTDCTSDNLLLTLACDDSSLWSAIKEFVRRHPENCHASVDKFTGSEKLSRELKELCRRSGVEMVKITPYKRKSSKCC